MSSKLSICWSGSVQAPRAAWECPGFTGVMHSKTGVCEVFTIANVMCNFKEKQQSSYSSIFPPAQLSPRWLFEPTGVWIGGGAAGGIWRRQSIAWLPILLSSYLSSYFSFCSSSSSSCSSCSFSFLLVLQMCLFMCKARWSDLEKHLWRNIEMFLLISKEKHEICMWNESLGKAGDEFLKMNLKKELYKWQMCSSAKAQLALFRCIFALK